MSKIWDKGFSTEKSVETFTVGKDREMDLYLAKYDVLGSLAHCKMLASIDLLTTQELELISAELISIYSSIESDGFDIEADVEDVHSQIELMLTRKLGDVGKKIHSGRSRNDQVLVDLKLYTRNELHEVVTLTDELISTLLNLSDKHKGTLIPGYTHLQVAMPSSFGLWFAAYAESLTDDLQSMLAAWRVTNRNPLGSAAGYGSSFPLNRQMTTDLLGFDSMNYNVVYAQMGRGKMERVVTNSLSMIAATLSKLAYDACLYSSQNFGFIELPKAYTTGSSIMPHKKNPDVFELIRAKCNKIQAAPMQIMAIANNLPSGYFRDLQIIKELFLPLFDELKACLSMTKTILEQTKISTNILSDSRYDLIFSVEEVNRLVLEGVPFRDAYKQVGLDIEAGQFSPNKSVSHTHEGSIGNLCNDQIEVLKMKTLAEFDFEIYERAINALLRK